MEAKLIEIFRQGIFKNIYKPFPSIYYRMALESDMTFFFKRKCVIHTIGVLKLTNNVETFNTLSVTVKSYELKE